MHQNDLLDYLKEGRWVRHLLRSKYNNIHKITNKWSNTLKWLVEKLSLVSLLY